LTFFSNLVRARLLNTQGKKTKRKVREKQLDEGHHLAFLQKHRELRAAGIEVHHNFHRKHDVDYNTEIPFEKLPAIGFHDTTHESFDREGTECKRLHVDNRNLAGKDHAKLKRKAEEDLPAVIMNETRFGPIKKSSKLVLPTPQISDIELEQIVKFAQATETAKQRASVNGTIVTETLLGDYHSTSDSN
jgi:pre-mRNA-splicing factor CDC5/CEF1